VFAPRLVGIHLATLARLRVRVGFWVVWAALLTGFVQGRDNPQLWEPSDTVTRAEALEIASCYAEHRWRASESNLHHGADPQGVMVDTPDAGFHPVKGVVGWWRSDSWNTGLPYKWGGFDTPQDFDRSLAQGLWAGDVFTTQKRELNDDGVSRHAAGIDCSGFISRCWRLRAPVSTYQIHSRCTQLPDFDALRPGDVVNKEHVHVALFVRFDDPQHKNMLVYDVGCPPNWKVVRHLLCVAYLQKTGFRAWRYRGMRD
jgi:hypothetical protein